MHAVTLFHRLILRPLRRERLRTSLTIAAVALGVAAVVAIELAGEAAAGSFHSSMETLIGRAEFEVISTGGVAPETLTRLAQIPYALTLHPRIEDYAVLEDSHRTVPLLGIDLVGVSGGAGFSLAAPFGPGLQPSAPELTVGDGIWTGNELGYKAGDRVKLLAGNSSRELRVQGVLGENSGETLVMDLALAARLLGRERLDRILIETPRGSAEPWEKILKAGVPEGTVIEPEGTRTDENRRMLAAFRWNLRVLSYIALAVAAFLIYNTISVSVVRRRAEIGIVRALGATRAYIVAALLGEAGALGVTGAAVGILLGRLMAEGAVRMVGATVQSLYVSSRPAAIALGASDAMLALAIGSIVSIVSALLPAWEAAQVAPVEAMGRARREHEARLHRARDLAIAAVLALVAWIASRQGPVGGKPVFGYVAAALLLAASAMSIPSVLSCLGWIGTLARRWTGVESLLASRGLTGSLRRTSVLAGALSTAVAMLAAVGIMVGSFRETVVRWMADRIQADFYLRPAAPDGPDRFPTLPRGIAEGLRKLPDVAAVEQIRSYPISYQSLPTTLAGADLRISEGYATRAFLSGRTPAEVFEQLVDRDAAVVSEPFANKHHVRAGDSINLELAGGMRGFRVVDVYYDYSGERGIVLLDRSTLLKYLPDPAPSTVAVFLKPGTSLDAARHEIEASIAGEPVTIATNRSLREEGIRVFDRTFAITYALEAVAVFVAVMGVSGALLALVIDRRREFGLLRFLGAEQGQVRRMILFEAGLLGLLATAVGLILGFFLSLVLIYVINKQSFGWTIQFHWPVAVLGTALAVVYTATLLAALYPARVVTRLVPIEVVHEE